MCLLSLTLLLLFGSFAVVQTVNASGTLDQQQTNESVEINVLHGGLSLAQTFTAGLTGTLTEVDLAISCFNVSDCPTSSLTVQIFSGTPPGTGPLGSQTISGSTIPLVNSPPFTVITFSIPIVAGNIYSIILTSSPSGNTAFQVWGSKSNPYAAGDSYHNNGGGWALDGGADWAFETFVTTTSPPIPEYPLGLPILAILTIIAYGIIKRKIRPNQNA